MVAMVDIVNRSLQAMGTRTTITNAQLQGNLNNESIQANIAYIPTRNALLRMAPWNCGFNTINLSMISAVPGTPENTSGSTNTWQKGQPYPPWAYEYQYPVDCLRMCWITPQTATGFASGVPITTAVTGGAPSFWQGPPVKWRRAVDQFFGVTAATVSSPGSGYVVGEVITLVQAPQGTAPVGAPCQLQVTTIGGGGAITAVSVLPVINSSGGTATLFGGSYFAVQPNPVAQGSTTGVGTGATFNLTQNSTATDQPMLLTNQEFAIGNYVKEITDENLFDDLFQEAFVSVLAARLNFSLTGKKDISNHLIQETNKMIVVARGVDGNEALVVNDMLPDWLRIRGIDYVEDYSGPYNTGFNWGSLWPGFS